MGRLIRVPDPDVAIYRIFPLWFLEETLRLRQLVLAKPSSWEDPFEVIENSIVVETRNGDRIEQVHINQSPPPVYAQCWSTTAESATLLRAYSRVVKDPHSRRNICPSDEGIRVRSTPRKLLQALAAGIPSSLDGQCFLGSVKYLPRRAVEQEIANAVGQHGPQVFEIPAYRARLLLMKRDVFSHEREVRAIFIQQRSEPQPALIRVRIDLSTVIDEISFDPRLETFERIDRERAIRGLGYEGCIVDSGRYQRTFLKIVLGAPPANNSVNFAASPQDQE